MKLTGSQIFVEVLVEQGVDTLFGYPGGAVLICTMNFIKTRTASAMC